VIQGDVFFADDDDRTAVSLALAALETEIEYWKTLVNGSADHINLLAAMSDVAARLAGRSRYRTRHQRRGLPSWSPLEPWLPVGRRSRKVFPAGQGD
jgi:hypothetical protein